MKLKLRLTAWLLVLIVLLSACNDNPAVTSGKQTDPETPTSESSTPDETPNETPTDTEATDELTLNGAPLKDYVIVKDSASSYPATTLQTKIKAATEIELSIVEKGSETGGKYIYVGNLTQVNSYGGYVYKISASGTEIKLDGANSTLLGYAVDKLISKYFTEDIIEEKTIEITIDSTFCKTPSDFGVLSEYELTNSTSKELYEGVTYVRNTYIGKSGKKANAYIAIIEPEMVSGIISAAPSLGATSTVLNQFNTAESKGHEVLVGINAGFFQLNKPYQTTKNYPYGVCMVNGNIIGDPAVNKDLYTSWFGITKDGKPMMGSSIATFNTYKGQLQSAVSGYRLLMENGKIQKTVARSTELGPNTVVAICDDGSVIFFCTDGRTTAVPGTNYVDVTFMVTQLGKTVKTVIALDGGGSTTFVLKRDDGVPYVANKPSDNSGARPVQSVLLLTVPKD